MKRVIRYFIAPAIVAVAVWTVPLLGFCVWAAATSGGGAPAVGAVGAMVAVCVFGIPIALAWLIWLRARWKQKKDVKSRELFGFPMAIGAVPAFASLAFLIAIIASGTEPITWNAAGTLLYLSFSCVGLAALGYGGAAVWLRLAYQGESLATAGLPVQQVSSNLDSMKMLRRLLCIPGAAVVAVTVGFMWASVFRSAYFSEDSVLRSLEGLAPLFLGRCIPVMVFVTLAAAVAPAPRLTSIAVFGVLGGVFGWPFGPRYVLTQLGPTFYLAEGLGAIAGAGVGMIIALAISRKRKATKSSTESLSGQAPPRS